MTEAQIVIIADRRYAFDPLFHARVHAAVDVFEHEVDRLDDKERKRARRIASIAVVMSDVPIGGQ